MKKKKNVTVMEMIAVVKVSGLPRRLVLYWCVLVHIMRDFRLHVSLVYLFLSSLKVIITTFLFLMIQSEREAQRRMIILWGMICN